MATTVLKSDTGRSGRYRLAKAVGAATIIASALSAEYGSGVNFVAPQSVGVYPGVHNLVPLAMFATGLVLLPKVFLFMRFSRAMPTAGSTYAWISRTLSLPVAFVATILWLVGVAGGIGVIAFTFGTFLGQALTTAGWPEAHLLLTTPGHIIVGLAAIWMVLALHVTGVRSYSIFIRLLVALIVISAVVMGIYGFTTPATQFVTAAGHATGATLTAPPRTPTSFGAFLSVMTLMVFAYGGINSAPTLGGEVRDASRAMPRGILGAWASAIVLYTLVTLALFHAVAWWAVPELVKAGHASMTTVPGVMSAIAPKAVSIAFSLLVALIVGKTLAPQLMACSRTLFALSQDHMLPDALATTNKHKAPALALLTTAIAGSAFLVEISETGFAVGVIVRSFSILVVMAVLGLGVLNVRFGQRGKFIGKEWATVATRGWAPPAAAVIAIIVGFILVRSVLTVPHAVLAAQPWFQTVVVVVAASVLYGWAAIRAKRRGIDVGAVVARAPLE